ncbi:MAG: lysophospholipase, partial [Arcanobacterium sp.]|nr:lysophospholipase [Arcanobacterium sp.]
PPRNDIAPNILQDLSKAYEDVCARRGTPFVETFTPLVKHDQWNTDLAISGGYTPHQAGYGLIAWLVLHQGWQEWINKN